MTLRRLALPLSVFILGASALVGAAYLSLDSLRSETRGPSAIGGRFSLIADDGRTVSDADMKGEPFLVFFGYTHCPDTCPTTLAQISDVFGKLGADKKVGALFITVDPERDTPAVLKDYLSNFDRRIIGLSGDRSAIEAAMKAYRVIARKVPTQDGDYSMDHTAFIYLMDKQGRFVSAFNLDQAPEAAARDLSTYL
ncbi:MAG: SCO family protein [Methylobacteriaceae bacterium]|nr:SCO family protein [Methylobacteriaceae bacterium]